MFLLMALAGINDLHAAPAEPMSAHIIQPHDTLIGIGKALLADPNQWPEVQKLNRIADPHRLRPGSELLIPMRLLRLQLVSAKVESLAGPATADGVALAVGMELSEGAQIETGDAAYVGLRLWDGSHAVLQPNSRMQIEAMRRNASSGTQQSGMLLQQGRMNNKVAPQKGPAARYEIRTPTAVIGVRGTEFRAVQDASSNQARVEVIEGRVGAGRSQQKGLDLHAGDGGIINKSGSPQQIKLLPAPNLSAMPTLLERPLMRLPLPQMQGAVAWRVIVALEDNGRADFATPVYEATERGNELRIAGLPDATYQYRLRGIDAQQLEGEEARASLRLKARPEPPFGNQPAPGAKQRGDTVNMAWTTQPEAASYRLQIAPAMGSFDAPILAQEDLRATQYSAPLPPGEYQWRLSSVRADGDRGPWGDAQKFTLAPPQAPPEAPSVSDKEISIAWPSEPGQRFEFEMASDDRFSKIVQSKQTTEARVVLPRPDPGKYWLRVRATDADGFVGAWSAPQVLDLPEDANLWPLLILLLPLLML